MSSSAKPTISKSVDTEVKITQLSKGEDWERFHDPSWETLVKNAYVESFANLKKEGKLTTKSAKVLADFYQNMLC